MVLNKIKIFTGIIVSSLGILIILFILSGKHFSYSQQFLRSLKKIEFNILGIMPVDESSYVAGFTSDFVYVGNIKDGTKLLEINKKTLKAKEIQIRVEGVDKIQPQNSYVFLDSPFFYIKSGSLAALFNGRIEDWIAKPILNFKIPYIDAYPISPSSFIYRTINGHNENEIIKVSEFEPYITVQNGILKKQVDGLLCTAGAIKYNKATKTIIYVHYYRNEYILLDTLLNIKTRGKTIDDVNKAKIKIVKVSDNHYSLASSPNLVNKSSCIYNNHLYVCSNLMALNEERSLFDTASVIDVYDLQTTLYRFSFYLPDYNNEKIKVFKINQDMILGLYPHYLLLFGMNNSGN